MDEALATLAPKIEQHLQEQSGGAVRVAGLEPLVGGACQDNLCVRVEMEAGPFKGQERVVLRSDAPNSLPGSLDRGGEFHVIRAATGAGVTTPPVHWLTPDLLREGSQAYFMEWRDGVAIGRKLVRDEKLADARAGLAAQLARELAGIHTITPSSHPDLSRSLGDPGDPVERTLTSVREQLDSLDSLAGPRPALELALRWMREHPPSNREVTLAHGDFRTGNFLVTPKGLTAVLDWEFAHWGTPADDLAWICVRDWRFGRLDKPVGGFATREELVGAYAKASGRSLEPAELHWWEVAGNVRWAAGCIHQGERYLSGERTDVELIAIPRRAAEMEYEALRLIEQAS